MDLKRKRITLVILLVANLLLLYFYYSEPLYFLSGAENTALVPENLMIVNKYFSVVSKMLFPVFSIIFMINGIRKLYWGDDFSILLVTAYFIFISLLNICYRFF